MEKVGLGRGPMECRARRLCVRVARWRVNSMCVEHCHKCVRPGVNRACVISLHRGVLLHVYRYLIKLLHFRSSKHVLWRSACVPLCASRRWLWVGGGVSAAARVCAHRIIGAALVVHWLRTMRMFVCVFDCVYVCHTGQGLQTRAKRATGKQGLRLTPKPEAPHYCCSSTLPSRYLHK